MPIPRANPEQRSHIQRDVIILLIIVSILCCLFVLLAAGGYFFYQRQAEIQAVSGTATSAYMATKIQQDTEIQATQQAEASATAQALAIEATATAEAFAMQATATAQALEIQTTATAQAKLAELMGYRYFDDFNNNNNEWRSRDAEDNDFWAGTTLIQTGVYTWQVTEVKDTFVAWSDFDAAEPMQDFDVAVNARREKGQADEYCYGLLFRKSPDGFSEGSYVFTVCENGYFKINYYDGEVLWEDIQDWTETSALNPNDWNLLEVSARGSNFDLFINHQLVASFSDTRLSEGIVSIFIDVYEKETGQIDFDFFALQPR
jgi:hypothetical protein